ncbi:MAG: amidohydrolase family protein [Clostridia bacterium]|nr:amidohydrolase family protein [Clostridia bacterium]
MIIDFHTHAFPDAIAEKTMAYLSQKGGIRPTSAGTLAALKAQMKESGVDISVVLPIVTAARQTATINRVSAELNGKDGVYFFGGIHPDTEDVDGTLDFIVQSGLRGIKLHPDYQGVYFDDPRYLNIMEKAARRNLLIVTHAGRDIAYPNDVHCTPAMVLTVLRELRGIIDNKLILAHMGGFDFPDDVLATLCGQPVWMDTAAVLSLYPDKCRQIIARHGAGRILFATDSPWTDPKKYIALMDTLGLSQEAKDRILYQNAMLLLQP